MVQVAVGSSPRTDAIVRDAGVVAYIAQELETARELLPSDNDDDDDDGDRSSGVAPSVAAARDAIAWVEALFPPPE